MKKKKKRKKRKKKKKKRGKKRRGGKGKWKKRKKIYFSQVQHVNKVNYLARSQKLQKATVSSSYPSVCLSA
jgi:hypothetical protein